MLHLTAEARVPGGAVSPGHGTGMGLVLMVSIMTAAAMRSPRGTEWTKRCQVVCIETSRPLRGDSTSFTGQKAVTR